MLEERPGTEKGSRMRRRLRTFNSSF